MGSVILFILIFYAHFLHTILFIWHFFHTVIIFTLIFFTTFVHTVIFYNPFISYFLHQRSSYFSTSDVVYTTFLYSTTRISYDDMMTWWLWTYGGLNQWELVDFILPILLIILRYATHFYVYSPLVALLSKRLLKILRYSQGNQAENLS